MDPNGAIEIVYPNDNNNNNKKKKNHQKEGRRASGEESALERGRIFLFLFFLLFAYFSYLRKLDRRFSSGLKAKLIYATRATRGHQEVGVSTNSVR